MSYLKMALKAMEAATNEREDRNPSLPVKVGNLHPVETPQPNPFEHILTCADCDFHKYQGPNPAHGWGRCTYKDKGCYGLRRACDEWKDIDS
jgi:hypothetical protein